MCYRSATINPDICILYMLSTHTHWHTHIYTHMVYIYMYILIYICSYRYICLRWTWYIILKKSNLQIEFPRCPQTNILHYSDIIMSAMASHITSIYIVCWNVDSGSDQRKHQRPASLAFVCGIHRWQVNSPHKRPVTRKYFHLITSSLCNTNVIVKSTRVVITYYKDFWVKNLTTNKSIFRH